jgi:hypothetical protein
VFSTSTENRESPSLVLMTGEGLSCLCALGDCRSDTGGCWFAHVVEVVDTVAKVPTFSFMRIGNPGQLAWTAVYRKRLPWELCGFKSRCGWVGMECGK